MLERTIFVTRNLSDELLQLCRSLLPEAAPHYGVKGTAADVYLYSLLSFDADWVVNLDEDAFLFDAQALERLQQHMAAEGFACCGMPDGGVVSMRYHNPLVPNPFFNVINTARLRRNFSLEAVWSVKWRDEWKSLAPANLLRSQHAFDCFECYYQFFFWMLEQNLRILYLDAYTWEEDGTSTILRNHEGSPFLLHCWYGRQYIDQKMRFAQAYNFCLNRGKKASQ